MAEDNPTVVAEFAPARVTDGTLDGFLGILGSAAPVPGGGGAAAVAGSMAAALAGMVCALTSGKARYASVQPQIDVDIITACELRERLLELANRDAAAFEPLARSYGLPHATGEERAARAKVMEPALVDACEPPIAIMEAATEVLDLLEELERIGSVMAVSDVGAAAAIASGAIRAASMNVYVNARSMADRDRAGVLVTTADLLVERGCAQAERIVARVRGRLS